MRSTAERPKDVGIWIRVSTEDQARGESPEHHEARARQYAELNNWKVRELYDLSGVSGKAVMEHPEAQRMLKDIKSGHITGLIFSKLARLARNTRELLEFSEIFREHDADLVSLADNIDTSTPAGRLYFTVLAAMAQWEREEIAERVAASVPVRAKMGKHLGGQASFGYKWSDGQLIPDPKEAPVRKLIYELFREHRRKKTVARLLNEQGYRTRNGSRFTHTTIERLVCDPTAKGVRRANYTKSTGSKKRWEMKPESDWVLIDVEPIVSSELWAECNAILDEQKKSRKPPARKTVHLFSGLIFCHCGGKMYVPSNSPKYTCPKCRNKIPVEDAEGVFQEQLKSFFFSPDEIAAQLQNADHEIKEKEELLGVLEKEQEKIKREMDKVYALYLDDQISKDGFGKKYQPLEERWNQIEEQVPVLAAEIDFRRVELLSSDEIVSEAKDLYSRWPSLPREEKRSIVETITESMVIGKSDIAINLCYLPSLTASDKATGQEQSSAQPRSKTKRKNQPHKAEDGGNKVTQPQGFIAATSWKRAG